jgi:carbonic anhydrase/acetyltransferase-like protein (isoleucine patch superfamily)
MLFEHDGKGPVIADSAYVAPNAVVCGDVRIGRDCRVLFGAVLVADGGPVDLGDSCVVMENALIRGRSAHPAQIGDRVLVVPHAHLNGTTVDSDVFIATGASLSPGHESKPAPRYGLTRSSTSTRTS